MDDTATVNDRLEHMGHEFRRLTGRTAYIRMETGQDDTVSWRFTDDTFSDGRCAVIHMESLLQIARQGLAGELLWWGLPGEG